ncbi:hypothetical protein O181_114991 [Austropuccinia psidii MF-1]|uniref:Uncharacterized protein n=1 Tax=Austropuccinia psidii MF-1 TaxID=1389203 RepID=A0A9Q3K7Y3_9BASI|nr:hypothetical protein [Austropuccinia psidii MF-1]
MCYIMTDVAPNSLLTTYKSQQRPLFQQDDTEESPNSHTFNRNHGEDFMISISETQLDTQVTMEDPQVKPQDNDKKDRHIKRPNYIGKKWNTRSP